MSRFTEIVACFFNIQLIGLRLKILLILLNNIIRNVAFQYNTTSLQTKTETIFDRTRNTRH